MRKTLAFLLISMFLCMLMTAPVLGAKAQKATGGGSGSSRVPDILPLADEGTAVWPKVDNLPTTSMGFAETGRLLNGYAIGITYYDYQHNGTMGRQIVQGPDGRVHFSWMYKPSSTPGSADRDVRYNSAVSNAPSPGWTFSHPNAACQVYGPPCGYTTIDLWGGRAVVAFHAGQTEDTYTTMVAVDFQSGACAFTVGEAPVEVEIEDACGGFTSVGADNNKIWPVVDAEDESLDTTIVHAVSCETDNDNVLQSILYHWCVTDGSNFDWWDCEEAPPPAEGGRYIDSVATIAPVVRQDPNSDEVALVWCKPREQNNAQATQTDNDVVYSISTNKGVDWGPEVNITNYQDNDVVRAYTDLTAMYDTNGCLHVVWNTLRHDPAVDGRFGDECKLYHWDDCNECISLINSVSNEPTDPGRWNVTLSKPNISQCDTNLYVLYVYFTGDEDTAPDASAGGYSNGELFLQASATWGLTWGPPTNITNTPSNGCAPGMCNSEHWPSMALYSHDSLYIEYVLDKDAGGWAGGGSGFEGQPWEDTLVFLPYQCFEMASYVNLSSTPPVFRDPFHGAPNSTVDTSFIVENSGNASTDYSVADDAAWLSVSPTSGTITAGCENADTFSVTVNAPGTEGLYQATITITYTTPRAELAIPVDFYCFEEFYTPADDAVIRTGQNELNVRQASGMGNQRPEEEFYWWADSTDYLFDGSLILATSRDNCNFNIFHQVGDNSSASNPWRELRALTPTNYDSTSYPNYRYAEGVGCTEDSTIAYTSKFYASKNPDSFGFYIAHFDVYAGPTWTDNITGLRIAYACDWDVPSDTGSDNSPGLLSPEMAVYQKGEYAGSPNNHDNRYGGLAYRADDSTCMEDAAGFVWNNDTYVYPEEGYHVDSLIKYIDQTETTPYFTVEIDTLPITDYNSIVVAKRDATIGAANTISFSIIVASTNPNAKTVNDLKDAIKQGERFICDYVSPDAPHCAGCPDCKCGDADNNGIWNISDAVKLIGYIFGGDPPPERPCNGDADGNGIVNISDAVYMITYIFGGGPEPGGCDPCQEWP